MNGSDFVEVMDPAYLYIAFSLVQTFQKFLRKPPRERERERE